MTLSSAVSFVNHSPDGVETTFAYNFRVDNSAHMKVYADGSLYSAAKTVTGIGDPVGGTVVFTTAPASSITRLTLIREVTPDQQAAYPFQTPFPSASHELALDKLTMLIQQLDEKINRSIVAPPGQAGSYVLPAYGAGKFWRWNPTSQEIEVVDLDAGITPIGISVGDLVQLEDVGGSAGLPAVNGGQLTDVTAVGLTGLTASRALMTNSAGSTTTSVVTAAELAFLSGVTSSIQTQVNVIGPELLESHTASDDPVITFTTIDDTYDEYEIHILNAIPVNDSVFAYLRTNDDDGASDYKWAAAGASATGGVSGNNDGADTSVNLTTATYSIGSDANETGITAILHLIRPAASAYTTIMGQVTFIDISGHFYAMGVGGIRLEAAAVTSVSFLFSGGNIESGEFKLYGVKK